MHKCVVCSNSSLKTKHTRPEVLYHSFPINGYRRKKWLKVYGIEQCYSWHRICSDHFLPQHYKPGKKRFLRKDTIPLPYQNCEDDDFPSDCTTQSAIVETGNDNLLSRDPNCISYTTQNTDDDTETENDNLLARDQNLINYTTQNTDDETETENDNLLARDQNLISYTTQNTDVETENDNLFVRDQNLISYTTQNTDVETETETENDNLFVRDQNLISYTTQNTDVETETETENDNLFVKDQNLISYTTQSTDVKTGNNNLLARDQNLIREEQSAVVNNFESPRRSCRKIKLTTTNVDMSYENMPRLQTERFERQSPTLVANDNIQPVIENVEVPMLRTTKDYTLGSGALCSVKNCYNRYSKDLSFFGYPSDYSQRKLWIEKCGLEVDPTQKVKPGVRVCGAHFEDHCFMNAERKNRLRPNSVPSLFLDADNIETRNKLLIAKRRQRLKKQSPVKTTFIRTNANKPSCSATNYVAKIGSQETPLLVYIESIMRRTKDFTAGCCIQECITNFIDEKEEILLYAPPNKERAIAWGSALGLPLTENSVLCERHFRPEDLVHPTLLVNGVDKTVRSLPYAALPIPLNAVQSASTGMPLDAIQSASYPIQSTSYPMPLDAMQSASYGMPLDAMQSASNAMPLETNDVPVLRTYAGYLKRHKADEQLSAKKNKIDSLDKSKAATNKMYFSKNENKQFAMVTNDTPHDNSTCDLNEKSNTVIPVDLSIVKIEPNDDDSDFQTNFETETDQIVPIIKPEPVENNDSLPLSSIDDSLSVSLKKLKKISSNSSLSITLEPIDNTKITEPSVNLLSKMSAKSSMSITLQPKLHNNLSSTTNNSSLSVSLIKSFPSTSSSSVYNISQQRPLQYKPEATSITKMPHKLSSNTVIHPEIIDKQLLFLKPTANTSKSNSSELPKIKTPVISKCISLAEKSHTHSNSDSSKNNSEVIVIDDDDIEAFIQEDNGFIYEISKIVTLPTLFWKTEHNRSRNSTIFCQRDNFYKIIKKIDFNNSLLPTIHIYGKKYEYNKPIKTKNELHNLIKKIDSIVKCVGFEKFDNDDCTGFFEGNLGDVPLCSSCQKKYQKLPKAQGSQIKTTRSHEQKVSEKSADLLELKGCDENNRRNPSPEIDYITLINCMVPRH